MQPQAQPGVPVTMPTSPLAMPAAMHAAVGRGDGALLTHGVPAYHGEDDAGKD